MYTFLYYMCLQQLFFEFKKKNAVCATVHCAVYTTLALYPHPPLQGKETVGQIKQNTT